MAKPNGIEIIARGVWRAAGEILLCRSVKKGYFYLPGGHVETGEAAPEALARELLEETGERPTIGRGLAVAECLFSQGGSTRHEINLVFHVEHDGPRPEVRSREASIGFQWVGVSELSSLDLRPRVIRTWLTNALRSSEFPSETDSRIAWLSEGAHASRAPHSHT